MTRLFLCAGEPSGDLLGSELATALQAAHPNISLCGMGSKKMQQAGVELVVDCSDLAIVGLWEVVKKLPQIKRTMKSIVNYLTAHRPDAIILIDYPGFNLRLAKAAKQLGIKVIYYSCPQIWAWHYSRIKKIKRYCDHMLTLFPFEEKMYQRETMPATFVGHPMVQRIQPTMTQSMAMEKHHLDPNQKIIALLPGSRISELNNLLPDMLAAAKLISQQLPDAQFILPLAENFDKNILTARAELKLLPKNLHIIEKNRYDVLQCADAAIAVSGTVTLELALLNVPMVIIYRVSPITYVLGKNLMRAPYFGLCNIVAEEVLAKELLQQQVTPENIANEIMRLLNKPEERQTVAEKLARLQTKMVSSKPAARAAAKIMELVS